MTSSAGSHAADDRRRPHRAQGLGDCIDCNICVQVCPTGIDMSNGLQAECIGCAACIDACDQVMDKMNYPRGLIRYSTENAVKTGASRVQILHRALRPRVLIYSAIFIALTIATAWSLATRVPLKVDLLKDRSVLYRELDDGAIENTYSMQVTNASEQARTYTISVGGLSGARLTSVAKITVPPATTDKAAVSVRVDPAAGTSGSHNIRFRVEDVGDPSIGVTESAKFLLP